VHGGEVIQEAPPLRRRRHSRARGSACPARGRRPSGALAGRSRPAWRRSGGPRWGTPRGETPPSPL
jgi:hypothetical protein